MDYWRFVIEALEKAKQDYVLSLARGEALDYNVYQNLVGCIRGIDQSIDIVKNTLRSIEENERSRDA